MERTSEIRRTTGETDISVAINLDGSGKALLLCFPESSLFRQRHSFS